MTRTILVVEDEPKILEVVRDYLADAGFAVSTAGDGVTALATARAVRPDLVVLDLGLPGLDGLDVARELHRRSPVPIIMLTARAGEMATSTRSNRWIGLGSAGHRGAGGAPLPVWPKHR